MIKNEFNYPECWYKTCKMLDSYEVDIRDKSKLSVTTAVDTPKRRVLKMRHYDEINEDCSDMGYRILGSAVHYIVEIGAGDDYLTAQRFSQMVDGIEFTGKIDHYQFSTYQIVDNKTPSVYAYIFEKDEYERQINCYAWLLWKCEGLETTSGINFCIFKDFRQREFEYKLMKGDKYPGNDTMVLKQRIWSLQEMENYIYHRVRLHKEALELEDDEIPICTEEERWRRESAWAVMQKGRKSAIAVNNPDKTPMSKDQALDYIRKSNKIGLYLEERPSEDRRCMFFPRIINGRKVMKTYCLVNKWCNYYKENYGDNPD